MSADPCSDLSTSAFRPRLVPSSGAHRRSDVLCFQVLAEAEPGVMPRVLELFAKRNLVPHRWHSDVGGRSGRELSIDLQVAGLSLETGQYIARSIRQLHYVDQVLISEKTAA